MPKKNEKETPQDMMKMLMFQMRAKRVARHMDTVVDAKECVDDSSRIYDKLESEQARFHYMTSHLFSWSAVLSDDLCDLMDCITDLSEKMHYVLKRLDKLEGGSEDTEDTEDDEDGNGDNDFTFGGF